MPAVQHGVIQRFEHVGEQRHNVQKWLKNTLYTVKPENAYRHAPTMLQRSSFTQRRIHR